MNVITSLLQIFVVALLIVAILGVVEIAVVWREARRRNRARRNRMYVAPPPLTNDQRIREYQLNERAYRGLR